MKINLLIIFFLAGTVAALSQSNFKEGYIINLQNDTIYGYIDFRIDQSNAVQCRFKSSPDADEEVFQPGSIYGYRFVNEGKFYVSKIVEIDNAKQSYFLEYLLQGIISLYYLPFDNGHYFFESADGTMIGITKEPDQIVDQHFKEDTRYRGVLTYVFRDYLPLSGETSKVNFNKASIIEFTKEYHDRVCDTGEQCIIFEHDYKRSFIKVDYTISGGVDLYSIRLYEREILDAFSLSPVLTVGMSISSPRLLKSLFFNLDGSFSAISVDVDYLDIYNYYLRIGYRSLLAKLDAKLEYIYDKGRLRPAIGAGISTNLLINPERTFQRNHGYIATEHLDPIFMKGPVAGIGFDYHFREDQIIALRLSYAYYQNDLIRNNTFQLKVGYKF